MTGPELVAWLERNGPLDIDAQALVEVDGALLEVREILIDGDGDLVVVAETRTT